MHIHSLILAMTLLGPLWGQVQVDYGGVDAWLARAKAAPQRSASWEAASAATEGGQMAEAAWGSFGPLPSEWPAPANPEHLQAFVAALRHLEVASVAKDVIPYFPAMAAVEVRVKVVANGFPVWGDMYVRRYRRVQGGMVLDEQGQLAIVVHAGLVAGSNYGTSAELQALGALQVIRHEVFHVYFDEYRRRTPGCKGSEQLSASEELLLTLQNEGFAHYLADRSSLTAQGFPKGRGEQALQDLEAALVALRGQTASPELLLAANEGPFWSKYAAISGMLFTYGVAKAEGDAGLKACILAGPASLISHYVAASVGLPELPKPGPETLAWAKVLGSLR